MFRRLSSVLVIFLLLGLLGCRQQPGSSFLSSYVSTEESHSTVASTTEEVKHDVTKTNLSSKKQSKATSKAQKTTTTKAALKATNTTSKRTTTAKRTTVVPTVKSSALQSRPAATAPVTTTTNKVKKPTAVPSNKTTSSRAVTTKPASNLFFPAAPGGKISKSDPATLSTRTLRFAKVVCRLLLPEDLEVRTVGEDYMMYVELYRNDTRVGRIVYNIFMDGVTDSTILETTAANAADIQTRQYRDGDQVALTYCCFIQQDTSGFYHLEMDANSIRMEDFRSCVDSFRETLIFVKDTYPTVSGKTHLRVAVVGNSYIHTSDIGAQLQQLFDGTGKNAQVTPYTRGMASTNEYAEDSSFMATIGAGTYDVLFMCGLFGGEDLPAMEAIARQCDLSGTKLVLFPAYNESVNTIVKATTQLPDADVLPWKTATQYLISNGITDTYLMVYDAHYHPRALGGYAGALMIYHYLYGTVPMGYAQTAMNSLKGEVDDPTLVTHQVYRLIKQYMDT